GQGGEGGHSTRSAQRRQSLPAPLASRPAAARGVGPNRQSRARRASRRGSPTVARSNTPPRSASAPAVAGKANPDPPPVAAPNWHLRRRQNPDPAPSPRRIYDTPVTPRRGAPSGPLPGRSRRRRERGRSRSQQRE